MDLADQLARGTLDALPLNVAVLDSEGVILASNLAWRRFGHFNGIDGAADAVGTNYLAVAEQADEDAHARRAARGLRDVIRGERDTFSLEYPCHSSDTERWFSMHASRFLADEAPYLVVAHEDITSRKLAELQVERRNEELEAFARLLSHDLRNPLTVAVGRAELLAEETDSEHVATLRSVLDRMDRIIESALTTMRTGTRALEREEVALRSAAERAWKHVETADATLVVEHDLRLHADRELLAHVFENLYRNAVEHAGTDATVTVGALDGGFYVEDDGSGIPPDEREAVFEMGFTTGDGTGLGLGIVEHVVANHGWEVDATTGTADGARFEVRVRPPALEAERPLAAPGPPHERAVPSVETDRPSGVGGAGGADDRPEDDR